MSPDMNILLFGDQATDYHYNLRLKLREKNNPILSSFLDQANAALCEEVARQPRLVRDTIPPFSTLLDLVDWFDEVKTSNPAVESAICTTCQIACLISRRSGKFVEEFVTFARSWGSAANRLQQGSTNQSWSIAVMGMDRDSMDELLRQFNSNE
ncbi:MAG: hypothetical protein Q9200_005415, partial [Gallowayella weberi]